MKDSQIAPPHLRAQVHLVISDASAQRVLSLEVQDQGVSSLSPSGIMFHEICPLEPKKEYNLCLVYLDQNERKRGW